MGTEAEKIVRIMTEELERRDLSGATRSMCRLLDLARQSGDPRPLFAALEVLAARPGAEPELRQHAAVVRAAYESAVERFQVDPPKVRA